MDRKIPEQPRTLTERPPQVLSQCDKIESALGRLHKEIDSIETRISPILRPPRPAEKVDSEGENLVPLASRLRECELLIYSLCDQIEDIIARTEL